MAAVPSSQHGAPPREARRELPRPRSSLLSLTVLAGYVAIFAEAVLLYVGERGSDPRHWEKQCMEVIHHLWVIYAVEVVMAVGPGLCAMQGWTVFDVLIHHVPYILVTALAEHTRLVAPHINAFGVSTLTALNEGALVAIALGAPVWVQKARRLYGFSVILLLAIFELQGWYRQMQVYSQTGVAAVLLAPDNLALLGLLYHLNLIRLYGRRWLKHKEL